MASGVKINKWLLPLSWIFGIAVWIRNYMFDKAWLKSRSYSLPIIGVGNLSVGGTGKTPHVEYLVALLRDTYKTAVVSRGYKRKSKGFVLADKHTTADDIGDEPYQIHSKFPNTVVAVCADRCEAIDRLLADENKERVPEVILLDDAFQHRFVKPGLQILLTDYGRLFTEDRLLPAGRLREPKEEKERADIVIITKCPPTLPPFHCRVLKKKMALRPFQLLFFTTLKYGRIYPLYETEGPRVLAPKADTSTLLIVGVARPQGFISEMRKKTGVKKILTFPDHHNFTEHDVRLINDSFDALPKENRTIITTEKDACRLLSTKGLSLDVQKALLVQPIEVEFLNNGQQSFNNQIKTYVRQNQSDSRLAES